jgi:hypothetical protein
MRSVCLTRTIKLIVHRARRGKKRNEWPANLHLKMREREEEKNDPHVLV